MQQAPTGASIDIINKINELISCKYLIYSNQKFILQIIEIIDGEKWSYLHNAKMSHL